MKYNILLLVPLIITLSCQEPTNEKSATIENAAIQKEATLDWLVGDWNRTNDAAGSTTFEQWAKESDQLYRGLGFTLQEGDTVFKEELEILVIEDNWNLVVTGVNETPTYFAFTNQTDHSFVCENAANEFPKKIEYVFQNEMITATVSAGEDSILFVFKRQ